MTAFSEIAWLSGKTFCSSTTPSPVGLTKEKDALPFFISSNASSGVLRVCAVSLSCVWLNNLIFEVTVITLLFSSNTATVTVLKSLGRILPGEPSELSITSGSSGAAASI